MKPRTAAIYARVSTDRQTTENQLTALRAAAERHGWEVVAEYVDEGISGAKGRDKRPQFDALLKDAVRRKFSVVMAWSVDRLGRSLRTWWRSWGRSMGAGSTSTLNSKVSTRPPQPAKPCFR